MATAYYNWEPHTSVIESDENLCQYIPARRLRLLAVTFLGSTLRFTESGRGLRVLMAALVGHISSPSVSVSVHVMSY